MMSDYHRVRLNLPAVCDGALPHPGEPLITIDGEPVKAPVAIAVTCTGGRPTAVTLTFLAEVEGNIEMLEQSWPREAVALEARPTGATVN